MSEKKDEAEYADAPDAVNPCRDGAARVSGPLSAGPRRTSRNAGTRCLSSASRNTDPTSRISIGSIPTRRRAARCVSGRTARSTRSIHFPTRASRPPALGLVFDSLFATSPDEPSTQYGLIAECASYPDDYSSVTFKLRPEAKFNDGQPITPEDVIFSFEQFKKVNPFYAFYYKNVVKAEKTGDHEVKFTFDTKGNRELPMIVGEINVVSQALLGRQGRQRQAAQSRRDDRRTAARQRCLQDQVGRYGAQDRLRARSRLLGERSARDERAI